MKTNLRIVSTVLVLLVTYVILPQLTNAMGDRQNISTTEGQKTLQVNFVSYEIEDSEFQTASESEYEPPNYGGPESSYGSGTR
ncbi:hypothetical protein [Calothrix sp. 336/3]|uniref:hypothetical protein n=1 Tax=Calothrix sp. 336/3 TaxID=1337936 RepID=UPI0004E3A827|nr:hypothetical protein [Calothrix sp. 336/3]AKG22225.1 hypothetical protein IJ00_13995 [Calothrix sp. 336/3]